MSNGVRERLTNIKRWLSHLDPEGLSGLSVRTEKWLCDQLEAALSAQERSYGVLPCGCVVGLVDDVFAIKSVCPNHVAQEPPTASEGCGSVTYGYRPCILCGHETSLVCGKCKLPICAKPEHDDQCLHQELIAAAEKARKLAAAVSAYIDCNDETNINRLLAALKEVENG